MTTATANIPSLADLLDSRQDLREILAKNLNLAHSCLLLRRGESEAVEKALDLAVRQNDNDTLVVAECIQIELLRLSGEGGQAVARAESLALKERFHPAAALYLRNLFPLIDPSHRPQPQSVASVPSAPSATDSVASAEDHSASLGDARDSQVMEVHPSSVAADPSLLPPAWSPVSADPALVLLRIRSSEGVREVRHAELAMGALEDATLVRSGKILEGLGFGSLRHASFEGSARCVHAWQSGEHSVLAVFQSGGSASLLAARCTKAFQEVG